MQQFYQIMKRCAAALVLIAVVCSLYVGASRVQAEQSYKNVNLSVSEAEIISTKGARAKMGRRVRKTNAKIWNAFSPRVLISCMDKTPFA